MVNIVCFGEVLFDVFSTRKKIGGAPLNVANRLTSFGNQVAMISAIGRDHLGEELLAYLKAQDINVNGVQVTDDYKTGMVNVTLNAKGSASYDIMFPRAWDKIQFTQDIRAQVEKADAFVFGSLVARDNTSRQTLYSLLDSAKFKIFDLNLRPPYYTLEVLDHLMRRADFIKFNDDELYEVSHALGSKFNSLEQNLWFIAEKTKTDQICVTKGAHGAVLLYNNTLYYNSGFLVQVKDTVGAGDSFLGALTSELLNDVKPQKALDFACAVGALVARSEGANPKIERAEVEAFLHPR
ncbi:carbohydrate kinase family protein [Aestuariivivens sediminicola]|uniref:carbohydrate kinase family protein n=1 Tax=Aestuariivivens sediminicola TaxID=2913560 RepID=UPI001F5A8F54|nr:carbohydrate kinase [Aestuariivivens sediminicola]